MLIFVPRFSQKFNLDGGKIRKKAGKKPVVPYLWAWNVNFQFSFTSRSSRSFKCNEDRNEILTKYKNRKEDKKTSIIISLDFPIMKLKKMVDGMPNVQIIWIQSRLM